MSLGENGNFIENKVYNFLLVILAKSMMKCHNLYLYGHVIKLFKQNKSSLLNKFKVQGKILIFSALIFLSSSHLIFAQKQNNIWCFGDSAGIDFNNISNPLPIVTSLDTRGSCVSIADSLGQLLFYANTRATITGNTTLVWNKNNQIMENGDSIVGRGWYNELLILPTIHSNVYYLFSVGATSIFGFYYSIVDINQNNGLGKVIQKNIQLDSLMYWEGISAVKHANGRDWWVITKDYENTGGDNNFHIYFITPDTIMETNQSIGVSEYGNSGIFTFSKDATKFLFTSYNGVIEVMDFDRCTGQFSNPQIILNASNHPKILGSAFSPNGNVIYVSTCNGPSYLVQYDLTAANIFNSRDTIASILSPQEAGGALRLAPDGKIYWSCIWENGIQFSYPYADTMYHTENMNLSVINDPDVVGSGCNFSLYSFNLGGKRCYWGLPNNPDYSLGPVVGSICDSLSNGINEVEKRNDFSFYPNPANRDFTIFFSKSVFKEKIIIVNDLDQRVFENEIPDGVQTYSVHLPILSNGIYFVSVRDENSILQTRKLIVAH
jgi:hypothetical protein